MSGLMVKSNVQISANRQSEISILFTIGIAMKILLPKETALNLANGLELNLLEIQSICIKSATQSGN